MSKSRWVGLLALMFSIGMLAPLALALDDPPQKDGKEPAKKADESKSTQPQGPGGFGPKGPGGFMGGKQRELVKQFDKNNDGWLNNDERKAARDVAKNSGKGGFGKGGFGKGGEQGTPKPGPKVATADVKSYPDKPLYEPNVLRTFFLEFENKDWEKELEDFHGTDVEVPCTLTADGKKYSNVGVHFRGMSSYMMIRAGQKRSLNLSMDLADKKQRLYGYKTLNLLNSHEDPTFMNTVLYSQIARQYIAAPKANFVKVVVNGESWGVYVNEQQFNKEFTTENFKTSKGARWKVRGNPGAASGLEYIGENVADYKRKYEIKSGDDEKAWKALINLCKTLNQTPPEKLEAALKPIMDVDSLLWFLALDVALINCDGYWVRSSDYSIFLDDKGKFHIIPQDINEAFRPAGGPGFGDGPGGPGGPGGGGRGGFGGGGGAGFTPPRPGEVLPAFVQENLKLTDAQKKQLEVVQKDVDGKVEKLLTADQRKQIQEMRERGPGGFGGRTGGPGGAGGGPGGPGGAGGGPGGRGPGGRAGFGPPRPGEVLPPFLQETLKLSDAQKKQLEVVQKDVDGKLEKLLTGEQRKQIQEMRERGLGGFGPGGPGGPGGGPGGPGGGPGGRPGGPGGPGGGFGGRGVELDPLVGLNDSRKPLRSKILAVPSLKAKYLQDVRTIAEKSLDWKNLGPIVAQYRSLIEKEVEADTKKLESYDSFLRTTADQASASAGRGREMALRAFADQRRKYLLDYSEGKKPTP